MSHTITATSANKYDITEIAKVIRKDDAVVYCDSGYLAIEKREDIKSDNNLRQVDFRINKRPSQNKITAHYQGTNWDTQIENRKSSTRCKVEHQFFYRQATILLFQSIISRVSQELEPVLYVICQRQSGDVHQGW